MPKAPADKTNLTELAEYFRADPKPQKVTLVPMQRGESYAQAFARQQERRRRIEAKVAAK